MRLIVSCLLLTTSLVLPAHLARAEGSGTIIINSDGTFSDSGSDDADNPLARHDAARAAVIKAEKIQPPEKADPAPIRNLEPESEPVQKPATKKPAVKKIEKPAAVEAREPEVTPAAKPVKVAAPKAAKPKKAAKVEKAGAEQAPKIKWNKPPKKKHKPVAIETAPVDVAPPAPVHPLTRDQALRAAIQVAPPFRSSRVVPEDFKGRHAFRVMLQTEDGQVDILVDGVTGDILKE